MEPVEDREYIPTNREKKQEPKLGFDWCSKCDRDLVGHGGKCLVCGTRNGHKRRKK